MPMSADEAVEAIARHEDAAHHLTSEELAPYTAHRQAAEAAIREAFAIADRARAELEKLEATMVVLWGEAELWVTETAQRDLLKRILGEEGST